MFLFNLLFVLVGVYLCCVSICIHFCTCWVYLSIDVSQGQITFLGNRELSHRKATESLEDDIPKWYNNNLYYNSPKVCMYVMYTLPLYLYVQLYGNNYRFT